MEDKSLVSDDNLINHKYGDCLIPADDLLPATISLYQYAMFQIVTLVISYYTFEGDKYSLWFLYFKIIWASF